MLACPREGAAAYGRQVCGMLGSQMLEELVFGPHSWSVRELISDVAPGLAPETPHQILTWLREHIASGDGGWASFAYLGLFEVGGAAAACPTEGKSKAQIVAWEFRVRKIADSLIYGGRPAKAIAHEDLANFSGLDDFDEVSAKDAKAFFAGLAKHRPTPVVRRPLFEDAAKLADPAPNTPKGERLVLLTRKVQHVVEKPKGERLTPSQLLKQMAPPPVAAAAPKTIVVTPVIEAASIFLSVPPRDQNASQEPPEGLLLTLKLEQSDDSQVYQGGASLSFTCTGAETSDDDAQTQFVPTLSAFWDQALQEPVDLAQKIPGSKLAQGKALEIYVIADAVSDWEAKLFLPETLALPFTPDEPALQGLKAAQRGNCLRVAVIGGDALDLDGFGQMRPDGDGRSYEAVTPSAVASRPTRALRELVMPVSDEGDHTVSWLQPDSEGEPHEIPLGPVAQTPVVWSGDVYDVELVPTRLRILDQAEMFSLLGREEDQDKYSWPRLDLTQLARDGWVYIYVDGHLWREVYVDEEAKYHDVNLKTMAGLPAVTQYTSNEGTRRPTAGGSDTLLLPHRLGAKTVKVEVAWSKVQWSWYQVCMLGGMDPKDPRVAEIPATELEAAPGRLKSAAAKFRAKRMTPVKELGAYDKRYKVKRGALRCSDEVGGDSDGSSYEVPGLFVPDRLAVAQQLAADVQAARFRMGKLHEELSGVHLLSQTSESSSSAELEAFKRTRQIYDLAVDVQQNMRTFAAMAVDNASDLTKEARAYGIELDGWLRIGLDLNAFDKQFRVAEIEHMCAHLNWCNSRLVAWMEDGEVSWGGW